MSLFFTAPFLLFSEYDIVVDSESDGDCMCTYIQGGTVSSLEPIGMCRHRSSRLRKVRFSPSFRISHRESLSPLTSFHVLDLTTDDLRRQKMFS